MTEFFAEFGLRDWLLIVGPVFIVGILVHGYWRMRTNRNTLKMSLDKSFVSDVNEPENAVELSMLRAELPNGGARVKMMEQQTLNLDDSVPVLMHPVDEPAVVEVAQVAQVAQDVEATPEAVAEHRSEPAQEIEIESQSDDLAAIPLAPLPKNLPEKYVVINVMSVGDPFKGQELLECLIEQDMTLGEMSIFHRLREEQSLFSLMNAVEPGSFDLNAMGQIETPAVSMFMRVHELHKPTQVFQEMLNVADALAEALGGEVRDETRSVMTSQTIEHCHSELEEYEYKNHS
ncbi:MAG: cell division protein ZipA [Candidatus Azotimanducaceae bacterium]|jgi:cell division protein ZipA